jgi:hypothetical protein
LEVDTVRIKPVTATRNERMKDLLRNKINLKIFVLAITFLLFLLSCSKNNSIEQEVKNLKNHTMPPNSRLVRNSQILRKGNLLSIFWEFESEWQWKGYLEWVTKNLDGEYSLISANETEAHFQRTLTGDVYNVQIENISTGSFLRVRVKFEAYWF